MKSKIKENDILVFRNGLEHTYTKLDRWILTQFYDDNLRSLKDEEYDIINIKRPYYENLMSDNNDVHNMSRLELETELIEKRLQVNNLIEEVKRKDEYIKIYSNGLNKIMEKKKVLKNGQ